jgi:2'-5' RNA ligase
VPCAASTTDPGELAEPDLRLFVALELPEAVRVALRRWAAPVCERAGAGLRPVAVESLHVTLRFLGGVAGDRVEEIGRACEVVRGSAVGALEVSRALWLPRRRPRVLTVELEDGQGDLRTVQEDLSGALSATGAGQPDARRTFLPHVTVARVGRGADLRGVCVPAPPTLRFEAEYVVLFRSHLGAGPARYEALHRVPLSRR